MSFEPLAHAPPPAVTATRQALLATATTVFAATGYRAATVRDICRRAGANVAAVNYHFGTKAGLYREVLRYVQARADERHPFPPRPGAAGRAPALRLATFVHALLFRLLDPGPDAAPGSRLMSREMMEPTVALELVVREYVQPVADELRAIVTGFLGPRAPEEQVRAHGMSIVSQCLFYHQCQPVIRRLFPDLRFTPPDLERLAAHITGSCVAALRAATRERRTPPRDGARPGSSRKERAP